MTLGCYDGAGTAMALARRLPVAAWLTYWRLWRCYFRYTVEGLHHLDGGRAAMIVGYHGRPIAYDMCMLTVVLYDRLGYLPHGVVHRGLEVASPLTWAIDALGFITRDGEAFARAVARGEHVMVTPGGGMEGCRDFRSRYHVNWQKRTGYLRLACKYRLPIVPVAAAGADDTYIGLNDAEALGRRLGVPRKWAWALWTGIGPLGLYPFSPPFPVRLRQLVGQPIDPWDGGAIAVDDDAALARIHGVVVRAVQDLLDQARGIRAWESGWRMQMTAGR